MEKLLDIENVPEFSMEVVSSYPTWNNIYVRREKSNIEVSCPVDFERFVTGRLSRVSDIFAYRSGF